MKLKNEDVKRVSDLLKIMANETRLSILCLLSEGPMTVNELTKTIDCGNHSAISQHLKKLKDLDWVKFEREGQFMRYSLREQEVIGLIKYLKNNFCGDDYEK